jgi:hypothetical protein
MAYKLAEAYVEFSQKGVNAVRSGVDRIKGSVAGATASLQGMAGAIGLLGGAVSLRGLWSFVEAASEAERQTAKLQAVLASTNAVSGQTVDSLEAHASALQKVTAFEDDTIKGAQAVLLTFKKIGGEAFPQATEAALDLATVFEGDLKGAAMMVGKALEDPVRGITALRRAGVSFTKDQQDVIKSLVETGKAAEAQAMILKEINSQVGGSARKVGDTTFGQIEQLKNALGDLAEEIGGKITPAVRAMADVMEAFMWKFGGRAEGEKMVLDRLSKIEQQALGVTSQEEARRLMAQRRGAVHDLMRYNYNQDQIPASVFGSKAYQNFMQGLPEKSQTTIEAEKRAEFQALKEQGRQKEAEWFGQRALGTMKEFESLKNVDFDSLKKIEAQNAHMVRIQEQQRDYLRDIAGMAALKEITDQMARFE